MFRTGVCLRVYLRGIGRVFECAAVALLKKDPFFLLLFFQSFYLSLRNLDTKKIAITARIVMKIAVRSSFNITSVVSVIISMNSCALVQIALRQANATVKPIAAIRASFSWRRNSFLNDFLVLKIFILDLGLSCLKNDWLEFKK